MGETVTTPTLESFFGKEEIERMAEIGMQMARNFQPAHFMCPSPYKIGDIITMEENVYPPWWRFWQKPVKVLKKYEVKSVCGSN